MQIVEATLVKRYVDEVCKNCGISLMEMRDEVQLGKIYRVDLDSRKRIRAFNVEHGVWWETEYVQDVGVGPLREMIPTQMLMRNGMAL